MAGAKRISSAVLHPLKEALTAAFWYKRDLRAFLTSTISNKQLLAQLDWADSYKRALVSQLVDHLAADQHLYFDDLLNLLLATAEITEPSHLKKLEDGEKKYREAVDAIATLRLQVEPYRKLRGEEEEADRRRAAQRNIAAAQRAMSLRLEELRALFQEIIRQDAQQRGYSLEAFLNQLFSAFDIDSKESFRIRGEQIDGGFSHEGTEYIVEAKWQNTPIPTAALDVFASKISRKLDNTLGLFVAMNGFQPAAVEIHSTSRPVMILMDGADLNCVLESRIELPELLRRKRQHAARTGEIFLSAYRLLG